MINTLREKSFYKEKSTNSSSVGIKKFLTHF